MAIPCEKPVKCEDRRKAIRNQGQPTRRSQHPSRRWEHDLCAKLSAVSPRTRVRGAMNGKETAVVKVPRGVVYAAFGTHCLDECSVSIDGLSKRSPFLPFVVFTDEPDSWIGRNWKAENVVFLARDSLSTTTLTGIKIEAIARSPFSQTLYLDTDTAVLGDVSPLFDLLDRFDVAACTCTPWFGQCTAENLHDSQIPLIFPEYNAGVLVLNSMSSKTINFVTAWKEIFQRNQLDLTTRSGDQQAFREAVWVSDVAILTLKQNFNYWADEGIHMPVVIAHKILNKQMNHPRARPQDLMAEISSLGEDKAWALLCALRRGGATTGEFKRLKRYDINYLSLREAEPGDSRSVDDRLFGDASIGDQTTLPSHVMALSRKLQRRFGAEPRSWRQRILSVLWGIPALRGWIGKSWSATTPRRQAAPEKV